MVIISSAPASEFTIPDEDVYVFRLTEVGQPETRDNPFYNPDVDKPHKAQQTQVRLIWTIEDPSSDFHGETVHQFYNLSLGTVDYPSKIRPFIAALTGSPVDDSLDYDFDELVERKIRATLTHADKKSGGKKAVLTAPMAIRPRKTTGASVSATEPRRQPQSLDEIPFDPDSVPY